MSASEDNMPVKSHDVAVLIVSWDGYVDLWKPFFNCFFRFWPDCPYPVYLGTNSLLADDERVKPILIGEEVDYCSNLIAMLKQLDTRWVITWVEDFFPAKPIENQRVTSIVDFAERTGVDYANLVALPFEITPLFAGPPVVDSLGEAPMEAPYRASMGTGLWKRESLIDFLVPGETVWDLERIGAQRSADLNMQCLCVTSSQVSNPTIKVLNGIERKRWKRGTAAFMRSQGFGGDLKTREIESKYEALKMLSYSVIRYSFFRLICAVGGRRGRHLLAKLIARRSLAWIN